MFWRGKTETKVFFSHHKPRGDIDQESQNISEAMES